MYCIYIYRRIYIYIYLLLLATVTRAIAHCRITHSSIGGLSYSSSAAILAWVVDLQLIPKPSPARLQYKHRNAQMQMQVGDFHRIYPAPPGAAKLAARYEAQFTHCPLLVTVNLRVVSVACWAFFCHNGGNWCLQSVLCTSHAGGFVNGRLAWYQGGIDGKIVETAHMTEYCSY